MEIGTAKEDKLIEERKENLLKFIKKKYAWISYIILAIIVYLSVRIRTSNIPGLKDITTGGWALGPDLDPYLFLRWAKYLVEHGSLYALDIMRYSPIGYNTKGELLLHPYMMAWFHNILNSLGFSQSIEYSAIIYPVFFWAITLVAFFLLVRKVFIESFGEFKSNIMALIASFFLSVLPSILPRTIAGIPEKESAGFFFIFISFYVFLCAWKAKSDIYKYSLAALAGILTACMYQVWGGVLYIYLTLGMALFLAFIFGRMSWDKIAISAIWIIMSFAAITLTTSRTSLSILLTSTTTLIPTAVILTSVIHILIFNTNIKKYLEIKSLEKVPKPITSLIITIIIGIIIGTVLFGISFVPDKIGDITQPLITPVSDRLALTVAENKQPFFGEWEDSFGPHIRGIALFFWLFFIGSIYLYYKMIKSFERKERIYLSIAYAFFLIAIVFSRYSSNSIFNGTNGVSIGFYVLGVLALVGSFGFYYNKLFNENNQERLNEIDFGLICMFAFFFLSLISARGAVRTIMVLVPPASVMVSFIVVEMFYDLKKIKESTLKTTLWIIVAIILISSIYSGYYFYNVSSGSAKGYVPSAYNQQWQKAMSWVRENTAENAVFGHWWDYGYWLQSIGNRATVLDGGNAMGRWNHDMGRYGLTGTSNEEALNYLYSHNTTHFLIDSTDIGKYPAFSSIGSDANYDRYSWITAFVLDRKQSQEKKNSTILVYTGGTITDEDIIYEENGTKIFLPGGQTGLGAIMLETDSKGDLTKQAIGVFIYKNKQYYIPLKYSFSGEFREFDSGIESGVFIFPSLLNAQGQMEKNGAAIYLSKRTVKSQLARLYLYKENNPYFKLVHSEDDFLVSQIKTNSGIQSDFVYDMVFGGGIRGPIRIWEINYPSNVAFNPYYLTTDYPLELLKTR